MSAWVYVYVYTHVYMNITHVCVIINYLRKYNMYIYRDYLLKYKYKLVE